jgi:hypothetical protein
MYLVQIMYTHVRKCKNDKIKFKKVKQKKEIYLGNQEDEDKS